MDCILETEYFTEWGENLVLCHGKSRTPMVCAGDGIWRASLPRAPKACQMEVWKDGVCLRKEWKAHPPIPPTPGKAGGYRLNWLDEPEDLLLRESRLGRVVAPDGETDGHWRGAGTAVPVFSLRSEDSFGVGDFHDLKKLIDWAAATGQQVVQLLPINDTSTTLGWEDSYPYNAVTAFGLHPLYLYLPDAGVPEDKAYKTLQKELNQPRELDYERVMHEKMRLLRTAFAKTQSTLGADYAQFCRENQDWLPAYAVFRALTEAHGTADTATWGEYALCTHEKLSAYTQAHPTEVAFHCFLQYHLDRQLKDAVAYAHKRGVGLKGDLPIGVSRTGADLWQHPTLFHAEGQAGAPPDFFSADGQNWGFPTYNWEQMEKTGYSWWKRRVAKMESYFDALRIDHILGFFRIWEIPWPERSGKLGHFNPSLPYAGKELRAMGFDPEGGLFLRDASRKGGWWHLRIDAHGLEAYAQLPGELKERFNALYEDFFFHRHNDFWREGGMKRLRCLSGQGGMLLCGEDLGMIPPCVPEVMGKLGILSLEIQRMPKSLAEEFAQPAHFPYRSVCTTGTHDVSTLRAWWQEDMQRTQRYYNHFLHLGGEAPGDCAPELCEAIVAAHLAAPSMLCVLPLQDWLSLDSSTRYGGDPADERINEPAHSRHYWRWRMHLTLETLLAAGELDGKIHHLIQESGRSPRA